MIEKYDPENHNLYVCLCCGVVSEETVIKECTRNEHDSKIAYLECPVCHYRVECDY